MKNVLKLGKALSKAEQKEINGGDFPRNKCVLGSSIYFTGPGDCCAYPNPEDPSITCYGTVSNGFCNYNPNECP